MLMGARKRFSARETPMPGCCSLAKHLGKMRICKASLLWGRLLGVAGLRREDVFIANVLKCRPPSNRDPRPEEIEACAPFLREQTRTIDPEVIVTLGKFSTQFILKTQMGISRLHGHAYKAGKFLVFPIFHPAAALYDGAKREALENDFVTLKEVLQMLDAEKMKAAQQGDGAVSAS